MKIAVIGTGKTGGAVLQLLGDKGVAFDSKKKPTADDLKKLDAAIVFVPGEAADTLIAPLLAAGIPAVWGTTGYAWPEDLHEKVKKAGTHWVIGTNFSLGMNLVRKVLGILGTGAEFLNRAQFRIHEVHHVHKKDAPSGTALSWKEWLGRDADISSERVGDVKGIHELHLETPFESLSVRHRAHDRKLFAEGALWTAEKLLDSPELETGLYKFEAFFDQIFKP